MYMYLSTQILCRVHIAYIKKLLYEEKFTIEGAKQKLKEDRNVKQLELFREDPKITALLRAKQQLESLLTYLSPTPSASRE